MSDSETLPYLRIRDECEGSIKRIQITKTPFTIGREPNNDLEVDNLSVSRYHAEIRRTPDGRYLLIDTESKHGTRINGTRISEQVLADGDEIALAHENPTVLRFELSPYAGSEDGSIKTITRHPQEVADESSPQPEGSNIDPFDPNFSLRITANQTRFLNPELIERVKTEPNKILRQLTSLYDLTNRMLPSTSLTELFRVWMDTLFDFLPVQCGAILLWNQAAGEFDVMLKRCSEGASEEEIGVSSTIVNQVFRDNVAVMTVDALNDDRFSSRYSVALPRIRSALSAPISSKSRVWGVCYLYNSIPGQFQSDDLEYLMATARAAGLVIENLRHEELAKITEELREAMDKLAKTQDQLVHAEHLASLGTLTAGVAHEINNPLAAILQSLDTALGRCARIPDEEMRNRIDKPLRRARDNGERIGRIVQDLRTFSRAERVRGEKADVRQEIESAFQILKPLAEARQIRLQAFYGELDWVEAPPTRLSQLLINIIQNAIHASADGGCVEAHTGRAKAPGEPGERAPADHGPGDYGPGDHAWIQIRDFGVGMTPEVKARIFNPFFTTKAVGVGTGLGLWVCQSIIKSLGGSIEVESEPGKGTIFTLNLRLHADDVTNDALLIDASN
ncbi:MAG TPA: ATP-binding protein [Blastocatellia bacterium]|nr:ATP-binding protein [Blastocatellia bacterium]